MIFDYFYAEQAESYSFYRIPKLLFTEDVFSGLSTEAKVLYGLILDRISLSRENGWIDEMGRVYVYYTVENVRKALNCWDEAACKYLRELETFGLIERKKQGLGKPAIVYVKNFSLLRKSENRDFDNRNSEGTEIESQELRNSKGIKTKNINTEFINTNPILSADVVDNYGLDADMDERNAYFDYLNEQLSIEDLKQRYPCDKDVASQVYEAYSSTVHVFETEIPMSVRAAEISAEGSSLYVYDPKGKAACAYEALIKDILKEGGTN